MDYLVIEHPSRGWYLGRTFDSVKMTWKPRFAWSIWARDKRVKKMYTTGETEIELAKMPDKVALACKVKTITNRGR